jgi:hypothetical protein
MQKTPCKHIGCKHIGDIVQKIMWAGLREIAPRVTRMSKWFAVGAVTILGLDW